MVETIRLVSEPDWPEIDQLMTNFDHDIDESVAVKLIAGDAVARYPGRNFNAMCWFDDGQFHAAVYVYHRLAATLSAGTPRELMEVVANEFGWD